MKIKLSLLKKVIKESIESDSHTTPNAKLKRGFSVGHGPNSRQKPSGVYSCDNCGTVVADYVNDSPPYKTLQSIPDLCLSCEREILGDV
jgi:hypothetical protein